MMILLYILIVLMMIAAVLAVEYRDPLVSVISVGIFGFCFCTTCMILGAIELAVIQLVAEVLILLILIRVITPSRDHGRNILRELFVYGIFVVFILSIMCGSFYAFKYLPGFEASPAAISNFHDEYYLLGVVAIVFSSVIGTLSILRPKGKKNISERDEDEDEV